MIMKTIQKEVLEYLKNNALELTPHSFAQVYYRIAKEHDKITDEVAYLDRYVATLDKSERDILPADTVTYYDLVEILAFRIKKSEITRFIKHLNTLMRPSVDTSVTYDIEKLILELSKNPDNLINDKFIKKLLSVSEERVTNDRLALKNKSEDIKNITELMVNYFDNSLKEHKNTDENLCKINDKLQDIDDDNLLSLKEEFEKVLKNFHETLNKNKEDLEKGHDQCSKLQKKIEKLEKNLLEIQKDKNIDYLTGLLNRRGFMDELYKAENEYEVFGSDYALIYFDLDHFKEVNDEYGHECGDVVLSTFSKLLKQLTRVEDVVARYGGEEFVALIHYEENNELEQYLSRVKYMVNKNSFKYKELRVKITFSAGVTLREKYNSYDETLNKADELLLAAKSGGRNRIFFDDGLIL